MVKSLRKKGRKLAKLEKARKAHGFSDNNGASKDKGGALFNSAVASLPREDGVIPRQVAERSEMEEPSEKIIAINFQPRSLDHAQIDRMDNTDSRAFVHKLFEANTTKKSVAQNNGLIRDKVSNRDPYKFLYRIAPPDAEVLEIKFRKEGRCFGFWVGNTFNVISVRTTHL